MLYSEFKTSNAANVHYMLLIVAGEEGWIFGTVHTQGTQQVRKDRSEDHSEDATLKITPGKAGTPASWV